MAQLDPDEPDEPEAHFHRDRREHGGAPSHLDDDQLARLTEEERVEAGLDDYDPDEVPPAEGDLTTRSDKDAFPPSHYELPRLAA